MQSLLLVAHVNRDDVGEAWVAYQWATRLAERFDVTVLTYRRRDRPSAVAQLPGARVVEWIEPATFSRLDRMNSLMKPGWVPFYVHARRWTKKALARGERFDLAHQPVPVAMRYPSPVIGLGIPTVVGPVGGSLPSPAGFDRQDTAPWYVGLRSLDRWRLRHDPLLRRTYEKAACVVGIAPYVEHALDGLALNRFETMSETGLESLPEPTDRSHRSDPVRLLFVGRVIRTKGVRDAIAALALIPGLPFTFDVVGDGFDREECERLVGSTGLRDKVCFHGAVPRARVDDFYRNADVFVFPSYREPGGNAVFEAMGWGLPLVVADRGGPGNVVDETCGLRLTPRSPDLYARDLADALRRLINDADLRGNLGRGAHRRAQAIALWDTRIDAMCTLFEELTLAASG